MTNPELRKKNRSSLIILAIGMLLTLAVASMPLYTYTIGESEQVNGLSLWGFIGSGTSAGMIILLTILLALFSLICGIAGLMGTWEIEYKDLSPRTKTLRGASVASALIAFLLIPAIYMANNYFFNRKRSLFLTNHLEEGSEEYLQSMDRLLFKGSAGEGIESSLRGLDIHLSGMFFLLLFTLMLMIIAAVMIRHGEIKNTLFKMLLYFFVVVVSVVTVYPYFVMLITGLRTNSETLDMFFLHILPTKWMWQNIVDILHRGVARFLLNSLLVAGGATGIAMLCGIPAAYALARMKFVGKKPFLGFVIVSQMFSPVVLLIGISQLMNTLNLNNSLLGLMLINAAFNQAFAIWLLRGTFISISPEMEEASLIDGCGTVSALTKVLAPMAAPGIVTALIFVFINAWNEYTVSTVLISSAELRPITVGITTFSSFNMIEWQYLFSASLLATIPVVILFMSIEKHLTAGLTSGGVKG